MGKAVRNERLKMQNQTSKITNRQPRRGFTLIEVMIATLLIGLAIAALVAANGTLSMANGLGTDKSTAEFLAEQIRELTALLAVVDPETALTAFGPEEGSLAGYDDVDDFDGATFSPPIGADRVALNGFAAPTSTSWWPTTPANSCGSRCASSRADGRSPPRPGSGRGTERTV
jgi:prepilin-type N-terminal cleavage/methylation domain-containing protein